MNNETRNQILTWTGIVFFVLGSWFLWRQISPPELTKSECYRLGSNERMSKCLEQFETPIPEETDIFIDDGSVVALDSTSEWQGQNLLIHTRVKNNHSTMIDEIVLKYTYFLPESKNCIGDPIDTETVSFEQLLMTGDTKLLSYLAKSPVSRTKMIYCVKVVYATEVN